MMHMERMAAATMTATDVELDVALAKAIRQLIAEAIDAGTPDSAPPLA
jgi:hypothetical protein